MQLLRDLIPGFPVGVKDANIYVIYYNISIDTNPSIKFSSSNLNLQANNSFE